MSHLPFDDTTDLTSADSGFVTALDPAVITADDGRVVWDNDSYAFLDDPCPDTAHPSLWRQARLCARQGLHEVTEGIYQVTRPSSGSSSPYSRNRTGRSRS